MLVHHQGRHGPRDVEVVVDGPDATVADLAHALDPAAPPGPLVVDGRPVAPSTPLDRAGVGDGAVLGGVVDKAAPSPVVVLRVEGGLDAGRTWSLAPGRYALGRDPGAGPEALVIRDRTVSRVHLHLDVGEDGTVTVSDAGSRNGTRLGAEWISDDRERWPPGVAARCGAARLRTVPLGAIVPTDDRARGDRPGAPPWAWHRPPVATVPDDGDRPIELPPEPEPAPLVSPVGAVAVLGSVAVGLVMVVVLGSWTYALFCLLGPVLMVAGAVDGRLRRRRSTKRSRRRRRSDLADLDRALTARARAHVLGLEARHPGPAAATWVSGAGAPGADPAPTLWAVRACDPDAGRARIGTGAAPWAPPLDGDPSRALDDVRDVVDVHRRLRGSPLLVELAAGRPLALVGSLGARRAVARSLVVQLAAAQGPADLRVGAVLDDDAAADWAWLRWLPHHRDPVRGDLLAVDDDGVDRLLAPGGPDAPHAGREVLRVVVVDDPAGLGADRSPARRVVRATADPALGLCAVVLAASAAQVPASCSVVEVGDDGTLRAPADVAAGPGVACGTARDVAAAVGRELARFTDPELDDPGRGLPDVVALSTLVGEATLDPAAVAARWAASGPDPAPRAVLGTAADGPLVVDLATDGPHALVAGTTGSGKSELLRTLVASAALACSPDHLAFVLVDFKGGSAFDACARLPHTTGVVTDLDEHLAARALRCLEAELRHREQRLRAVSAPDLDAFRARPGGGDGEPLPRLVVVVDEFATLAAEVPDFVDALLGIAQRGRSLGVHLVLATQRPSGAVSEDIRANTALRIALRVQDPTDSVDVIDAPVAADLPRGRPGRAVVRLGPRDLVPVQTAWTGAREAGGRRLPVRVRPLRIGPPESAPPRPAAEAVGEDPPTDDLGRLVDVLSAAWRRLDGRPPRRPWPDPLPDRLDPADLDRGRPLDPAAEGLVIGLADDPDHQRLTPHRWQPDGGPLLLVGRPGSGTTSGLASVTLAACEAWSPDELHVHVIDLGSGELLALAGLAHVGAVVRGDELERQRRLIAGLAGDLAARRARPDVDRPRRLLLIDGVGALHDRWDDLDPSGVWPAVVELIGRGAEVGIHAVLAADGPRLPTAILGACRHRLVLRLGDPADAAVFGISPGTARDLPPGRAIDPEGPTSVQLPHVTDRAGAVAELAALRSSDPAAPPARVRVLPESLDRTGLEPGIVDDDGGLRLVLGVADRDLGPATLVLGPGGHALVAGPPRSGRTTALASLASAAAEAGARVVVVARGGRCGAVPAVDPDDPGLAASLAEPGPLLVVVDDADLVADDHPVLAATVRDRRSDRHVIAAARADRARSAYAHWLREVRADRCGLLLQPDPDLDGELTGSRLPRRPPLRSVPGRGWSTGEPEGFVQVAVP